MIIGSLGVLIEAKRKGIIPLLKPYVEILRQSKTHFGEDLLNYALLAVGVRVFNPFAGKQ